jgi:hypothetical protein
VSNPLHELTRFHGVEFVLSVASGDKSQFSSWGLDDGRSLAAWTQTTMQGFRALGETLQAGLLNRVEGFGPMQNVAAASRGDQDLCVGFYRSLPAEAVRETMPKILNKWAS